VAEPVEMRRLHATLLDLAGIEPRRDSLALLARDGAAEPAGDAQRGAARPAPISASAWPYAPWARHLGGRFARRLYLYRVGAEALVWDGERGTELYDLTRDVGMRSDLSATRAARTAELLALAREHFAASAEGERLALEDDVQERLRALGYALH
jgi:hypothetical protein